MDEIIAVSTIGYFLWLMCYPGLICDVTRTSIFNGPFGKFYI